MSRFTAAEKAKEIEIEAAVRVRIYSRDATGRRDKQSGVFVQMKKQLSDEYQYDAHLLGWYKRQIVWERPRAAAGLSPSLQIPCSNHRGDRTGMSPRFTAAEKAKEIEIEAAVRIRIYSRGRRDKLSPAQLRKIGVLEEIAAEYREQAEKERSTPPNRP
jgi:DNA-directed RNA polymerase subunit E'/Rpb7